MATAWQQAKAREGFEEYVRFQRRYDLEVVNILREASARIDDEIRRVSTRTFSGKVNQARMAVFRAGANAQIDVLWASLQRTTEGKLLESARIGSNNAASYLEFMTRSLGPIAHTVTAAAVNTGELVAARLANNIELSPRVYRNRALTRRLVDREIHGVLVSGGSARDLARAVRHLILPQTPGGVSYAAMRLGRTELNNAFHRATIDTFAEYPWVEGVKWNLSRSHPRADKCDDYAEGDHEDMGAGVFSPGKAPGKPHPQCLCYTTAVTVKEETFVGKLLGGGYDSWLTRNGFSPIGRASA